MATARWRRWSGRNGWNRRSGRSRYGGRSNLAGFRYAFELLQIWGFTFYAIAYLALFAIPLLASKSTAFRSPTWLRILALSGLLLTLLFVLLSVFPIIRVHSESAYTWKTIVVLVAANLVGLLLYRLRAKARAGIA